MKEYLTETNENLYYIRQNKFTKLLKMFIQQDVEKIQKTKPEEDLTTELYIIRHMDYDMYNEIFDMFLNWLSGSESSSVEELPETISSEKFYETLLKYFTIIRDRKVYNIHDHNDWDVTNPEMIEKANEYAKLLEEYDNIDQLLWFRKMLSINDSDRELSEFTDEELKELGEDYATDF